MGLFDISFQMKGAEFPVIRGLEKLKLLHTGTCMSTSTRHVSWKSPLLLQFPYCELCDYDNKQSNYRLMNVLFCTRALLADFSISKVINDRRKKRCDFLIDFSPTCISLNVKFSIPTKNLESFSHFIAFLINHLVWRDKKCRFIGSSDRLEPELRDRCSWEKVVAVADFKRHLRQKYGSAQRFFSWFSEMKW